MKEISQIECIHIISEPGDMTRYNYILYRDGPDEFTIAPLCSTFRFPQRISYYRAKVIMEPGNFEKVEKFAKNENCNIHTLTEVCTTIIEIWEDK